MENNIRLAIKTIFGEKGAATPVKVIKKAKIVEEEIEFVLSCPVHSAVQVRASLTLQGSYQGRPCAYHVKEASDSFLSIADKS